MVPRRQPTRVPCSWTFKSMPSAGPRRAPRPRTIDRGAPTPAHLGAMLLDVQEHAFQPDTGDRLRVTGIDRTDGCPESAGACTSCVSAWHPSSRPALLRQHLDRVRRRQASSTRASGSATKSASGKPHRLPSHSVRANARRGNGCHQQVIANGVLLRLVIGVLDIRIIDVQRPRERHRIARGLGHAGIEIRHQARATGS